jgi:phage terminase large subunit-like protein
VPVVEWQAGSLPQMVPACQEFYASVTEKRVTHDGNPILAQHIANAVLKEDHRGPRIIKESKTSPRKIDAAVAAVIAHDMALRLASKPRPKAALVAMDDAAPANRERTFEEEQAELAHFFPGEDDW